MEEMLKDYVRLVRLEARVNTLIAYVKREKYSVDRHLICEMLGFEVEDGEIGEQDAD